MSGRDAAQTRMEEELFLAAWIEAIDIEEEGDLGIRIEIAHSYPPGISPAEYVRYVVKQYVKPEYEVEITYKRVEAPHAR